MSAVLEMRGVSRVHGDGAQAVHALRGWICRSARVSSSR